VSGLGIALFIGGYLAIGVIVGAVTHVCSDGEDLPPPILAAFAALWPITIISFVLAGVLGLMVMASMALGDVILNVRKRLK
jgi:hypothetical protein